MTEFGRKVLLGEPVSPEEWQEHLRDYHRRLAGATSKGFGRCLTDSGQTSYEVLARALASAQDADVLDLACGDGYLIEVCLRRHGERLASITGIDMSDGELAAAEHRLAGTPARLVSGLAEKLPFADDTFDVVLCHLAFMLMIPIEPVVSELTRVLRRGGTFAAVVAAGSLREPAGGSLWMRVAGAMRDFRETEFPLLDTTGTGDPRSLTEAGWRELFAAEVTSHDFEIVVPAAEIWSFVADTYLVDLLDEAARGRLRERVVRIVDVEGSDMRFPLRMLSVRPRS